MQLIVEHLACRRGGRHVFSGVGFTLGAGEALTVTGRNGAGKSTLLAALAGLLRPAAGTVTLSGNADRPIGERAHHLGHRDGLKGALTVRENLDFAAGLLGAGGARASEALSRVGLAGAEGLPAAFLSAGQRRRLALARLLVAPRPLWLLDEPMTALDSDGQASVAELIAAHLREGGIAVAATHAPLAMAGARELRLASGQELGQQLGRAADPA